MWHWQSLLHPQLPAKLSVDSHPNIFIFQPTSACKERQYLHNINSSSWLSHSTPIYNHHLFGSKLTPDASHDSWLPRSLPIRSYVISVTQPDRRRHIRCCKSHQDTHLFQISPLFFLPFTTLSLFSGCLVRLRGQTAGAYGCLGFPPDHPQFRQRLRFSRGSRKCYRILIRKSKTYWQHAKSCHPTNGTSQKRI